MLRHRTSRQSRFAAALAGVLISTLVGFAQSPSDFSLRAHQAPVLAVSLLPGEIIGRERVIRALIKTGTNEFMFVLPEGLRSQSPSEGTIMLTSRDMNSYVSIRSIGAASAQLGLKEALRERIISEHPQASNLEDCTTMVAGQEGAGLQLRLARSDVGDRLMRIVWVPFQAGVMEFTLNASNTSAAAAQGALDMVLLTFRSNERGKIEIVRRSDKT